MSKPLPADHAPTTVSLADEEGVERVRVDMLFGLWTTVNELVHLDGLRHGRIHALPKIT